MEMGESVSTSAGSPCSSRSVLQLSMSQMLSTPQSTTVTPEQSRATQVLVKLWRYLRTGIVNGPRFASCEYPTVILRLI